MTEILDKHQFRGNYSGEYGEYALSLLGTYFKGKPDTPGWRKTFAYNHVIPIPKNGWIFPHWALLDLYKLMEDTPGIESQILKKDISLSDIPSLEETVDVLSKIPVPWVKE